MNENDNKEIILKTALKLFSKKGYDAVGVQAVCEQAGVTKPTLYYYFGNKSGLLNEVLKCNYVKLNNLLRAKTKYEPNPASYSEDVYPLLLSVANTYINFAKNNKDFYKMVLSALFAPKDSKLSENVRDFNKTQYEIIENMFVEISKTHGNMKGKEKRLAWTFIGLINSCIMLDLKANAKDWVCQFMHGIF